MTEIVDRPHPQPLSLFGRGEKNVDRENLKIGITSPTQSKILTLKLLERTLWENQQALSNISAKSH
ncbi:hypothetical protein [Hydrococcus rivularis]|uniref:hypothetical protein n=1 Tax=Hydrococcus rivularis TaxID=1616834 RepID=UPI001114CB4B|nr:hypothetical protein [Hydrococcus rivularis]